VIPNKKIIVNGLLCIIVAYGLFLRLNFVRERDPNWIARGDAYYYYNACADNLLEGKGLVPNNNDVFTMVVVPPLYPLFLAAVKTCWKDWNYNSIRYIQAIISGFTVLLFFIIGSLVYNEAIGLISALLAAIYPFFIHRTMFILTETNYIFLLCFSIISLIFFVKNPKTISLILFSFVLGLTNLQRPNGLLLVFFIIIYFYFIFSRKDFLKYGLILFIVSTLVISPWVLRNYLKYNHFIPIASHGGRLLYIANHPDLDPLETPYYHQIKEKHWLSDPIYREFEEGKIDVFEMNKICMRTALKYMILHPLEFIKNTGLKAYNFFQPYKTLPHAYFKSLTIYHFIKKVDFFIIAFGIIGFILSLCKKENKILVSMLCIIFIYFCLFGILYHITQDGRMNLLIRPFLIIFSSYCIYELFEKIKSLVRPET